MKVQFDTLRESENGFASLKTRLHNNVSEINQIITKYRDIESFANHVSQMYAVRNQLWEAGKLCSQFRNALCSIRGLYDECEGHIVERCEEVRTFAVSPDLEAGQMAGGGAAALGDSSGTGETSFLDGERAVLGILDAADTLKDVKSQLGTIEDLSEIIELFGGENEFAQILGEYADEIGKADILKASGYMVDGSKLLDVLENGNTDALESLLLKYGKKGATKLLKTTSGVEGFTGATYISLAVNAGENFAGEMKEFVESPSLGALAGAVWGATGGALWDAGAEVAKDGLDLVYTIFGKEFDESDFDAAMDFVSEGLETIVESAGNVVEMVGTAVIDGAVEVAGAAWEGICNVGETVASWFSWF